MSTSILLQLLEVRFRRHCTWIGRTRRKSCQVFRANFESLQASDIKTLVTSCWCVSKLGISKTVGGIWRKNQPQSLNLRYTQLFFFLLLRLQMRQLTNQHGIPLIVDDRLDVALAVDADGWKTRDWIFFMVNT